MDRSERDIDRIIEMAWEDRTPFQAIQFQFGLDEGAVIELMRRELKPGSYKRWRKRVKGRKTKHRALREDGMTCFRADAQRAITYNRKSKRT